MKLMKLKLIRLYGGQEIAINLDAIVQMEKFEPNDSLITLSSGRELRATVPFDQMLKHLEVAYLEDKS